MKKVGIYEAKTQLPKLVAQVSRGRRITITKHGVPVAMLVPAGRTRARPIGDVIAELRAFGKGRRIAGLSLRAMIEEGRR